MTFMSRPPLPIPTHRQHVYRNAIRMALALTVGPLSVVSAQQTTAPTTAAGTALALSLAEALRLATGTSETISLARAGVLRSTGQQLQARSQLMPQLSAGLNWQKTLQNQFQAISKKSSSGSKTGGSDTTSVADNPLTKIFASPYTTSFSVTASQPVFTGGRASANIRAARVNRESAEIGITTAQAQVQLAVTEAYYDALLADRLVTIAESSLVQTERTLRQVQLTKTVGSASEFELIRARVTRDNQRPSWLQSRTNRDLAYVRLRQLLNVAPDQTVRLTDDIAESPASAPSVESTAPITTVNVSAADVLRADPRVGAEVNKVLASADTSVPVRAPVRQAVKSVEVAKLQLKSTKAQRYPTVSLSTNYQRLAYPNDGLPRSFGDFFPNWTAGFGVSFPFFTGGRVHGEELAAQATVQEAEQRLKQTEEGAALDARQTIAQLEQAQASWQATVGTAEQATRAYDIAEVRFREGISTQLELAETRVQLQQALANRAKAARDLQVARIRLQLLRDLPLATSRPSTTGNTP